jgi:hypothetical protein
MKTINPTLIAVVALALATSACAVSSETSDPDAGLPVFSGVCAPEFPDCDDVVVIDGDDLFPNDEPQDGVAPSAGASGMLAGGGLTVSEALVTDASGILAVQGFYVDDSNGPRLCEALAESFPPQCGGANVELGDLSGIDIGELQSSGDVTWSDGVVVIVGEIINGVLVPTPTSL